MSPHSIFFVFIIHHNRYMNWIDVVIILIIVLSLWTGWKKGFILGTLDLATWVGSILAGFYFYRELASLFEKYIPSLGVWTFPLSFIVVLLFARMIFSFIAVAENPRKNVNNPILRIFFIVVNLNVESG